MYTNSDCPLIIGSLLMLTIYMFGAITSFDVALVYIVCGLGCVMKISVYI